MRCLFALIAVTLIAVALPGCQTAQPMNALPRNESRRSPDMDLGNFSVSLAVKDLVASRAFYEKLGFTVVAGDQAQNWLILRNGDATIGLFHGMFERNILTFNPGWVRDGDHPEQFMDVREIQRRLKERGVTLASEADPSTSGPANIMFHDPDGNPILIDQHR